MANLSRDASLRFRNSDVVVETFALDNSAAQTIYRGQPMIMDVSADTVNPRAWVSSTTLVGTGSPDKFIGIANEPATVATTDVEASNEIEIITAGEVGFKAGSLTEANIGSGIVFTDSATLAVGVASATQCPVGTLRRVIDGYAYVELAAPTILSF